MMRVFFEKAHINMKMLTLLGKAFPAIGESMKDLEDPVRLHESVHGVVQLFTKGLEADHAAGYGNKDICFGFDIAEIGEESTESVPSGSNGYREVDADGSTVSGIPSSLLGTEDTGEVLDMRHETEVPSGEGA